MSNLLESLAGRLAPDVRFHSPVATYQGRADVEHLLATIAGMIDDVTPVRQLAEPDMRVTFFTFHVAGNDADGVLAETLADDATTIVELRLMLRPLGALLPAVKRMGEELAKAPLPSDSR